MLGSLVMKGNIQRKFCTVHKKRVGKKSLADETVNSCDQKREKALKATKSMFDIA